MQRRASRIRILDYSAISPAFATAVAEYHKITSPMMRIRHFNIAGVAWSNFKPGIDINGRIAIIQFTTTIDVVHVSTGVDVTIMDLWEGEARRLSAEVEAAGCGAALTTCLPDAA